LNGFVLDASVALRWFLDHPMPPFANRAKQHLLKGARAVVPALWHLEMSNGLVVAQRRSILTAADVDQAVIDLEQLVAQAVDTETSVVSARQSLGTARAFQLSAYDAVYLDLARSRRLTLATLDDRLRAAATQAGVSLLR
jgi:predicted nucleic acid-binding protein